MTNKVLLFSLIIFSLIVYLFIGGFDNLTKQSFKTFYESEKDLNYIIELDNRIDELLQINNISSSELSLLAMNLLADGYYAQSYKVLENYIQNFPSQADSELYASFAEVQYLLNNLSFNKDVLKALNKSLFLDPSNHKALTMNGLYLFSQSKFEEALKNWSIALENVTSEDQKKSLIIVMNSALKELEIKQNNNSK